MESLFGDEIEDDKKFKTLSDKFGTNPFSILDAKVGTWQNRKRWWKSLGIQGELGRCAKSNDIKDWLEDKDWTRREYKSLPSTTSVFDPVLCELMYKWFCDEGGKILDPFAGGSVRGIVANYLGYKYTGIDIREEQIYSNREQAQNILAQDNQPQWIIGDSNEALDEIDEEYDMIFSCPPYGNLEKYSNLDGDISNMKYDSFLEAYESIIQKACSKLKRGGHAIFVVGEFRVNKNYYRGFVPDTYMAFKKAGMRLYNEAILSTPWGTSGMVANSYMKNKKLVKVHQNILDFIKP